MAWTSGFFNSLNKDRLYNADQMSAIFDGLITHGVYEHVGNKLAVQPNTGMTVQINTGRGWFGRWVHNDSAYLLTLNAADVTLNRYAAICVRVDKSQSVRSAVPVVKYGALASTPVPPAMERSVNIKEYCLAYVLIRANAKEITAADIVDTRSNTDVCGWVTGLIEQVDTKTLYDQWSALFEDFLESKQEDFEAWYNSLQEYIGNDTEAQLVVDVLQLKTDMAKVINRCVKYTGVIDGLAWDSQTDGTYVQIVNIEGLKYSHDIIVVPKDEFKETYISMNCYPDAMTSGKISFLCTNPQDVNIEFEVIVFEFQ